MVAPRVSKIELFHAGPFDSATLELPPPREGQTGELFLFEGPNGSGKTTLAEAIAYAFAGRPLFADPQGAPEKTLRARLAEDGLIRVDLAVGQEKWQVLASAREPGVKWPAAPPLTPLTETVSVLSEPTRAAVTARYEPITWAAFAYGRTTSTPNVDTQGPREIQEPPLSGSLSFGMENQASGYFGQLLVNLRHQLGESALLAMGADEMASDEAARAIRAAGETAKRTLSALEHALSSLLGRAVRFKFGAERTKPNGSYTPDVLFDGEPIPLQLLGEGMRRTISWLTDLLVRLHRIQWADTSRSPHEQSFWLILDEVDESLHPRMQMRLVPALRELFPNANIYMTTHSPFVVASVGEGYVVPLRPDARHRVSGPLRVEPLHPGQSLEWVIEEVFEAKTGFIDAISRRALEEHKADIARLRRKEALAAEEWQRLIERRKKLFSYGEEIASMVAVLEVPVRAVIEAHESDSDEAPEAAQ